MTSPKAPTAKEALEALAKLKCYTCADLDAEARASRTPPADLTAEVERLRADAEAWRKHQEICTGGNDDETPTELDRLNPYKRGWKSNPPPTEQPGSFIHGVRYYLGMLEDDGNWSHDLGHIEQLCAEFRAVVDEHAERSRRGRGYEYRVRPYVPVEESKR